MDNVWIFLRYLRTNKTNDLDLYTRSIQQLCPLLFSMDHHNYARYLTLYCVSLLNLSNFHPGTEELLRNEGFSVNRSQFPNGRTAIDLTIEQTINKHAKTKGGIIGFSKNCPAYYRRCVRPQLDQVGQPFHRIAYAVLNVRWSGPSGMANRYIRCSHLLHRFPHYSTAYAGMIVAHSRVCHSAAKFLSLKLLSFFLYRNT